MDLNQSPASSELAARTRAFVADHVLAVEDEHDGIAPDGDEWRVALQDAARSAGVFGSQIPLEYGGHGFGFVDRAPVFEEAGYSLFGPIAVNCAAPDEANIHLLRDVADDAQRARYLEPLARGGVRSAFAMTEPAPGAGSDPRALVTRAERIAGGWSISGRKVYITGADGAAFFIVMARTAGSPGDQDGATMFLVDADNAGVRVVRHIPTMDRSMAGGHCEVVFDDCRVSDEAILGAADEGFRYAQVRLGPGRITHCMRWLGAARRAHEIAATRAAGREMFGSRQAGLGLTQQMLADSEIDLAASRALILRACWELDEGRSGNNATSIAKTFVAEAVGRIVDRSVQMCGGDGVSDDLPIARIYREVRPFRIYDGASEAHRWALARRAVKRVTSSS